jgi:hypothetical protein
MSREAMGIAEARKICETTGRTRLSMLRKQFVRASVRYAGKLTAWALAESASSASRSCPRRRVHSKGNLRLLSGLRQSLCRLQRVRHLRLAL